MVYGSGKRITGSYKRSSDMPGSPPDSDGNNWLITFSDVMTLLLIFFVMFFVATLHTSGESKRDTAETRAGSFPPPVISKELPAASNEVYKKLDSLIQHADMRENITIEAIEKDIIFTLKEKVTFLPGDAKLLKGTEEILDGIAHILKQHTTYLIEINGHTDNIPINTPGYPSNWELSVARATSVLKYFINKHGIDPSRFSIKGDGEQRPLIANDTPERRAQNRRVEIRLREPGIHSDNGQRRKNQT